jgi:hypothetical protein
MLNCPKEHWQACVDFILGPEFSDKWKVLELKDLKALQKMEVHERPAFDLSELEQWADFTVQQQRIVDDDDDEEEEEEEDEQVAADVEPPEDEDDPNQPDPPSDDSSAESD